MATTQALAGLADPLGTSGTSDDGLPPFRNEPFADFTDPATRQSMLAALARVRSLLGRE